MYRQRFELAATVSHKNSAAGEIDCLQDNQALQASTEFRIETKLCIVFIHCC